MKAFITIEGKTRTAKYSLDTEKGKHGVKREALTIQIADRTPSVGEVFFAKFYTAGYDQPDFSEPWVVLRGTREEIATNMETDVPMSVLQSHNIIEALEEAAPDEKVCLTFVCLQQTNYAIRSSRRYTAFRRLQAKLIADMLDMPADKVRMLSDPIA